MDGVDAGDQFNSLQSVPEEGVYRFVGCDQGHRPQGTEEVTLSDGQPFPGCPREGPEQDFSCNGVATWECQSIRDKRREVVQLIGKSLLSGLMVGGAFALISSLTLPTDHPLFRDESEWFIIGLLIGAVAYLGWSKRWSPGGGDFPDIGG